MSLVGVRSCNLLHSDKIRNVGRYHTIYVYTCREVRTLMNQPLYPVKTICMIVMSLGKENVICFHPPPHYKSELARSITQIIE